MHALNVTGVCDVKDLSKLGLGKLANLSRRKQSGNTPFYVPGKAEMAEFRIAAVTLFARHTPQDIENLRRISAMIIAEDVANDYTLHLADLVILPLRGTLWQIQDVVAADLNTPAGERKWNSLLQDFIVTTYAQFVDFIQGQKFVDGKGWLDLGPPRPEIAERVAKGLNEMLAEIRVSGISGYISANNKSLMDEMTGHLAPYLPDTTKPPELKK